MPYIDEYEIHEGIQLDKDKMEFDPSLRLFCQNLPKLSMGFSVAEVIKNSKHTAVPRCAVYVHVFFSD